MSVDTPDPERLAKIALVVAREAATILAAGYRSRPAATEKARADLVTKFDVESETLIRRRLGELAPDVAVVGEEQGGTPGGVTFYCDPLDGTMNFVHGHPFFCVSIGAMLGALPIAGAVVAPALGVEWWGGPGIGAFRDGKPCRVSETATAADALFSTGFLPDREADMAANLAALARIMPLVRGVRRDGSAALDCCFVADGTFDGYWERPLHAWDLAGGCAIALGAGATLTSLEGGPADLTRGYVALTNGRVHDALVRLLSAQG